MKRKRFLTILMTVLLTSLCVAIAVASVSLSALADDAPLSETVTTLDASNPALVYSGVADNVWDYVSEDVVSTYTYLDSVTYTGTFTQIEWWGEASENITSANIYIDGTLIISQWQDRVVEERNTSVLLFTSGVLERGEHTLKIEYSNPNSIGWIAVDKIVVYDDQKNTEIEKIDDADSRISSSGFGAFGVGDGYYSATVHSSNVAGSELSLTADHVRKFVLHADKSYTRGHADIYIDNVKQATINLFDHFANDSRSYPVWVSPVLDDASHTIKVVVTGTKDSIATDCWVAIDAIEVVKYVPETTSKEIVTTLDASNPALVYSGVADNVWDYVSEDVVSTYTYLDSVTYTGTFTQIEWWGEASENITSANVYLDGTLIISQWQDRVVEERNTSVLLFTSGVLERGEHTLKIEYSNPNNAGWIAVDKIVVYDDQEDVTIEKVDDADSRITSSGFGAFGVGDGYYSATVHSSNVAGSELSLTADHVRKFVLHADKSYTRGHADIYIDNVKQATINLFDHFANDSRSYPVWVSSVLSDDTHTIKVVVTGTKDSIATDCWVAIDAIEVVKYDIESEPVDDSVHFDDSSLGYVGKGWSHYSSLGGLYYKGTAHSTNTAGDYVTMAFSSVDSIEVYGTKNSNRGKADVYLDGELVATIDTYNETMTASQVIWSAEELSEGAHVVKIVNKGETSGTDNWLEIDKVTVKGLDKTKMLIHAENNSFIRTDLTVENFIDGLGYYVLSPGEKISAIFKGSYASILTGAGYNGEVKITLDGREPEIVSSEDKDEILYTIESLDNSIFHKVIIEGVSGEVCFGGILTDDEKLNSVDADMHDRAIEEIESKKNETWTTSDPSTWNPVDYVVTAPVGGVTLTGGIMKEMSDRTQTYLKGGLNLTDGIDSPQEFWVDILGGSNEGRLMQGYANSLLWQGADSDYSAALANILEVIRARQIQQDGYALPYDESAMSGYNDAALDERRNYDRAMFTRGLIAAGSYYESIGVATENNLAYTILRDFYDWFNYNSNGYGLSMLEGFLGIQGHPGSTLTYFTPVGKTEDMTYAELCYVQNWWMEYLIAGLDEAVWRFPLNRPHCYIITAMDAYLDHYRATGDSKYLDTCKAFWNIMKENFIHEGGSMAICEHQTYEPGSYYLESINHTGELCGTVFWTDFNYKMLQLFPEQEKYAAEIESSIINILASAQDENGKIRYHQNLNNEKNGAQRINSCCEVTSTGLLTRLESFIYQLSDNGVTVSLYNSSTLDVMRGGKHFALSTQGDMLTDTTFTIRITGDAMNLRLRIPSWCKSASLTINGTAYSETLTLGSYLSLSVNTGDVLVLNFNKEFSAVEYTGYSQVDGYDRAYLMYGPVLMAIVPIGNYQIYSDGNDGVIDVGCTIEEFLETVNIEDGIAGINGEFRLIPYAEVQSELFTTVPIFRREDKTYQDAELPEYDNKDLSFDFDSQFDYYAEGTQGFIVNHDKLYSFESGKEQKGIVKNYFIEDGSDICLTVSSTIAGGKLNGGIYIGVKDGVDGKIDTITAYNINIERAAGADSYFIKIHSFSYNGGAGSYNGCVGMARIESSADTVYIRVYVKDDMVYVYSPELSEPVIAAKLDVIGGGIGLRAIGASMTFESLALVGASDLPLVDNQAVADAVSEKISALGENITLSDKESVLAARAAYDALTEQQKLLVSDYEKLLSAEAEIARLESVVDDPDDNSGADSGTGSGAGSDTNLDGDNDLTGLIIGLSVAGMAVLLIGAAVGTTLLIRKKKKK